MTPSEREATLAAWARLDLARAVLGADRAVIDATSGLRSLVLELVLAGGPADELYDACAVLGRLLAQRGASPTLASATIDNAARTMNSPDAAWVPPARAALSEGFASALTEEAQRAAMQAWEFPRCVVPLGAGAMAVAAGHPSDDDEVIAAWSARIAKEAALRGVRRAVVSGGDRACAALVDALTLVGIEVQRVA